MDRRLIERWTDTTGFGIALGLSGAFVFPVLALGLIASVVLIGVGVVQRTAEFAGAAIVVLSLGGVVGAVGVLRASKAARSPATHNVTATLVCLAIGAATALALAGIVAYPAGLMLAERGAPLRILPGVLAVAALVIWSVFGIGRIQRVARRYAEVTGRALDGMPAAMLCVAIALATTAALITTTL